MNIIHYSAFRAIMLTGTVKGAAEIINKSQSTVSRLLDGLEYDLNLKLFTRRKGLITPTPEAYMLLEQVEKVYSSLESLKAFSRNLANGDSGIVTIGSMPALGTQFIPTSLKAIKECDTTSRYIVNVAMSPQVEEWAAFQKIDFGFAEYPFSRTGFRSEVFSEAPYMAAVPIEHPLSRKQFLQPNDLTDIPFISWTNYLSASTFFEQILINSGVEIEPAYQTSLSITAFEMVKLGLGAALIDPFTASVNKDHSSVKIMPFYPKIPFKVALLIPDTRPQSAASRLAIKIITSNRDKIIGMLSGSA